MNLRQYQIDNSEKGVRILREKRIVYYSMQVRTGKTVTALNTAKLFGAKNVLFLTKKKAINGIQEDYVNFGFDKDFELFVINNESMKLAKGKFDLIIHDESHRFGSFPKPSNGCKEFKTRFSNLPMIFLSGTPTPESYSQIFHQFWISNYSPFGRMNFYNWAKHFVDVKQKHLGFGIINDYSDANKDRIDLVLKDYFISFTQENAGFKAVIDEQVLTCDLNEQTLKIIKLLEKDLIVIGKTEEIIADTGVKLLSKLHQLWSGTIKFDSGNSKVIDYSKAIFIYNRFKGQKIAIFYKFKAELLALQETFGDNLTTDLTEFDNSNKNIALQIISGREGISLKNAEYLIYYNIDFSATSYWQSRDRLTTIDRLENKVFYVFANGGIEHQIFKAVKAKKSYTTSYFLKENGFKFPK
jgi:hypothetical protein